MTTSSEQITSLITGYTQLYGYFQGQKGTWDDAVQTARISFQALALDLKNAALEGIFIDQQNGDDLNDGRSPANPVASIEQAVSLAAGFGSLTLHLMTDYTVDKNINLPDGRVHIRTASTVAAPIMLTFAAVSVDDASDTPHFVKRYSGNTLLVNSVNITAAPYDAGATGVTSMFLLGGGVALLMRGCILSFPAGSVQTVLDLNSVASLSTFAVTVPADMGGRWIDGVPSGTDPLMLPHLAGSTIASL